MATGSKCIFELKGNIIAKDEKYNIMVLDLTGVSGSLVGVCVLGVSRSATDGLKSGPSFQFSPRELYPLLRCRTPLSEAVI